MPEETLYILGQALGALAVVLGFVSFQMKTSAGILSFQIAAALVFAVHYLLIDAWSAMALNLLACVQCVFYYLRDKRGSKSLVEPIVFTVLIVVTGALSWEDWYSAFIVLGLAINSISLALNDAQRTRWCMFVKSPLCLVYNALVMSGGGIVYECAVLLSSVIGTVRQYKTTKTDKNG